MQGSPTSPSRTSTNPSTSARTWRPRSNWVGDYAYTKNVLDPLDPAAAARALERLREMLAAHLSGNGVWFDSRAWIVTARRR